MPARSNFLGFLRYSIQRLCRTSKTNIKTRALKSKTCVPALGFLDLRLQMHHPEAGQLPILAFQEEGVLRSHLRHQTQHTGHHLAKTLCDWYSSSLVWVLSKHQHHIPDISTQWKIPLTPPGKLSISQIKFIYLASLKKHLFRTFSSDNKHCLYFLSNTSLVYKFSQMRLFWIT